MKICIVRHGQTDYNKNHLYQGRSDIELNKTGIEQAKETSDKLSEMHFDKIIVSPMKRTLKTAEIINKNHNIVIEKEEAILERGLGKLEGEKSGKVDFKIYWDREKNLGDFEIEPINAFFERVYKFYDKLIKENKDKDINILIITHNGVQIATNTYFNKYDKNVDLLSLGVNTCEYREYII